jgi:hypothetical protein
MLQGLVWLTVVMVFTSSHAMIPANPRTIAGIDGITPEQLGEALSQFCKVSGCISKLVWHAKDGHLWNISLYDGSTPVMVGDGCPSTHHTYCVETWGYLGKRFMSSVRTQRLKGMLEAKGAKVILMDCMFAPDRKRHVLYVCTNGKPPP